MGIIVKPDLYQGRFGIINPRMNSRIEFNNGWLRFVNIKPNGQGSSFNVPGNNIFFYRIPSAFSGYIQCKSFEERLNKNFVFRIFFNIGQVFSFPQELFEFIRGKLQNKLYLPQAFFKEKHWGGNGKTDDCLGHCFFMASFSILALPESRE
jgi:hypothetical protein